MTVTADPELQQAVTLHRQGQLDRAAQLYRRVLSRQPQQLDALQMLGLAEIGLGNAATALGYFERAVRIAPRHAVLQFNRGLTLLQLQRLHEAREAFDAALQTDPRYAKAHLMRATALHGQGHVEEALDALEAASGSVDDPAPLWLQRGVWLYIDGRHEEATSQFRRILEVQPAHADAWVNLGSALLRLQRPEEALEALERATQLAPQAADAWFNRGAALAALAHWTGAVASYSEALRLQPGLGQAWMHRGIAHRQLEQIDQALADFSEAVRLQPGHVEALEALGRTQLSRGLAADAVATFERVLALQPDRPFIFDALVQARMRLHDWRDFAASQARLREQIEAGSPAVDPTTVFPVIDSAALQLKCTRAFMAARHPDAPLAPRPALTGRSRIRVGYFSADFFAHATAFLLARVLECHDRTRFDMVAFSFGHPPQDAMHMRLRRAFGEFHDVSDRTDREIVDLARERGIDIAVDLKGLSQHGRPGVFAMRTAPVQAAYLGYPATLGLPAMDYLIADRVVVPASQRQHYTEKIVTLPHSYQANDDTRPVPPAPPRAALGLPEGVFVFCSFNSPYKITPDVFDVWMRLLKAVPGSVLWQLHGGDPAAANLRREASARGLAPERIIFAPQATPEAHLARLAHADLFLDTLPCNGHTTASDTLWAGVPVLTCLGDAFAGRVAASLLHAVGLPELVAESLSDYEVRALALASDPARLATFRDRLASNRRTHPLFDSLRFTRHLEAAYVQMHAREAAGLPPDHIDVASQH